MFTFDYEYENPDDEADTAFAQRTVHGEANLDELLNAMRDFLQAAGFTYVESLVAIKTGGDECASTDHGDCCLIEYSGAGTQDSPAECRV